MPGLFAAKKLKKNRTYISLFSSAGVGCYGFKEQNFKCIATSELIESRINIQKYNNKCKFLKINANTEYGSSLMRTMNAFYVPYVAMLDNNKRIIRTMNPVCMLNYGCAMDAIDKFVK